MSVIVDSPGGDVDAAYNLALLFRRYGRNSLTFIVPRWAKSAATLLVCAGDEIRMTPVAELGPLDPQIRTYNPIESRLEEFPPLDIESTLELIRDEFKTGNDKLADGLMKRLQFPLTLGSFKKASGVGKEYTGRLLSSRMLKDEADSVVQDIAKRLTEGYSNHGFCIGLDEAQEVGLKATELTGKELDLVWAIYGLSKKREELVQEQRRKEIEKRIRCSS